MTTDIIIFQHIAKTAGSSLAKFLGSHFPIESQLSVVPNMPVSALGTWPESILINAWSSLTSQQQQSIRFVGGHFRFGVHQVLPRASKYITLLRDPIDRVLSSFYYSIDRHFQQTGEKVSLEDYVFRKRHYDLGLNNYQTRVVSGILDLDPFSKITTENARSLSKSDLNIAIDNLRHYYLLVGTTEMFDAFIINFSILMGWQWQNDAFTDRENVTQNRLTVESVSHQVLDEIREQNEFDIQLYDYVKKDFESKSKIL